MFTHSDRESARGRRFNPLLTLALSGVAGLALLILFRSVPVLGALEYRAADLLGGLFNGNASPSDDIAIIGISENTLAKLPYRSPMDRGLLARLIRSLDQKGARVIALDLLIDQPTEPVKDEALVKAIREASTPVVVGWAPAGEGEYRGASDRQMAWLNDFIEASGAHPGSVLFDGIDSFGFVRRFGRPDEAIPDFSRSILLAAGEGVEGARREVRYAHSVDDSKPLFPIYELRPALVERFPPAAWIEGKYVLVGAVRPFEDRFPDPQLFQGKRENDVEYSVPGVWVLALKLRTMLEELAAPPASVLPSAAGGVGLAILAGVAGWVLTLPGRSWALRLMVGLLTPSLIFALNLHWLRAVGESTVLLAPAAATVLVTSMLFIRRALDVRRQRGFLRQAFSRYVSPEVVRQLVNNPERLRLGGETRQITSLFSDIEGFTTLSETMEPEQLSALMNEYFDEIVEIVFRHGGTVDKFIGDAVVAMFGAPGDADGHARQAVQAALEISTWTEQFAARKRAEGLQLGMTRIGVNTGRASVGNFGATLQFNYTALGDTVNTASRLEGMNKVTGTAVLISDSTRAGCLDIPTRCVARVKLKGKTESILVWTPKWDNALTAQWLLEYERAVQLLDGGQVGEATGVLHALQDEAADDPLVWLHLRRLAAGQQDLMLTQEIK